MADWLIFAFGIALFTLFGSGLVLILLEVDKMGKRD